MRYQTVAAGESWAVHGRFFTGRTVTVAMFDGEDGSTIALDSNACAEIGSTGIFRANNTQITTDPTSLTVIVWQMTDSTSGVTDEGVVVVGGHVDSVDADVSSRAAPGDAMDLVANAVNTTSVATGALTAGKFAANAITSTVLADNAITAAKIASAAITASKFGASAITSSVLATNAIGANQIAANAITAAKIATDAIGAAQVAANAIGASELAADAVTEIVTGLLATLLTSGESVNAALSRLDNIDADVAGLNDLSIADVQTALTNQGYTTVRAALLDNLDETLSDVRADVAALQAAVDALNDLSAVDVQSALTAQGYTTVRAALLDNLDAAVSSLNDVSVAEILGATVAGGDTVTAALSRLETLEELVRGGRNIDFVGGDSLGWQRVERDTGGVEVARYNLFDEAGARITGTVSAFIDAKKMIASEVLL